MTREMKKYLFDILQFTQVEALLADDTEGSKFS